MHQIGRKEMLGSDGRTYVVLEFQEMIASQSLKNVSKIEGMRTLSLVDGREVISLDNRLTIQGTDVYLTEID